MRTNLKVYCPICVKFHTPEVNHFLKMEKNYWEIFKVSFTQTSPQHIGCHVTRFRATTFFSFSNTTWIWQCFLDTLISAKKLVQFSRLYDDFCSFLIKTMRIIWRIWHPVIDFAKVLRIRTCYKFKKGIKKRNSKEKLSSSVNEYFILSQLYLIRFREWESELRYSQHSQKLTLREAKMNDKVFKPQHYMNNKPWLHRR